MIGLVLTGTFYWLYWPVSPGDQLTFLPGTIPFTYLEKEDKEQYLVLNDKGVLLKSTFLPKCQIALFAIKDNQFYYLHENFDTEEWEIHSLKIE
jgi:hypothetical protein